MSEGESKIFNPFEEERKPGEAPGRVFIVFAPHGRDMDVFDRGSLMLTEMEKVLHRDEKNVVWIEDFQGHATSAIFDIGLQKKGSIMGAYGFFRYVLEVHPNLIDKDFLNDEDLEKVRSREVSDDFLETMIVDHANRSDLLTDYTLGQLMAAGVLENEGYDIQVAFEKTGVNFELLMGSGNEYELEKLEEFVSAQKERENEIISQWNSLMVGATDDSPINLYARVGTAHSGMIERIGKEFDVISVCEGGMDIFAKEVFTPMYMGREVVQEDIDEIRQKEIDEERIMHTKRMLSPFL